MGFSRMLDEDVDLITQDQLNLHSPENTTDWPLRNRTWFNVAAEVNEYLSIEKLCKEPRRTKRGKFESAWRKL